MRLFDLHCDTIYECLRLEQQLGANCLAIDLERGCAYDGWVQTFACWISDDLRGEDAWNDFLRQSAFFEQQLHAQQKLVRYNGQLVPGKCNAILSVEGGAVLGGKLERIGELAKRGVKMLTLCWNDKNELASGALAKGGFTEFGRQCIPELERSGIVVDVSHLNEQGFWELCELAKEPFIATHSNSAAVHRHPRNLTDDQVGEILSRGGLIGLNFYIKFLSRKRNPDFSVLKWHIDHFLELGCEDILALGSDFDGASMPDFLHGIERIANLYQSMVEYYGQKLADKILFENANRFFEHRMGKTGPCGEE